MIRLGNLDLVGRNGHGAHDLVDNVVRCLRLDAEADAQDGVGRLLDVIRRDEVAAVEKCLRLGQALPHQEAAG